MLGIIKINDIIKYHICPCTNIECDNIEMGESMDVKMLLVYVACIIGIFIVGKIFIIPIKIITKLIINSFLGAVLLYVINIVGTACGLHIGINVVTALVVGILGIPGAVLLTVLAIFIWNIKEQFGNEEKTHFFISANGMYGMQKKFAQKGASLLGEWANFLFNCYWLC